MLNFFYHLLNNKKGFTLIEVLVVVAIIGILAALAAPRIMGRIEDSRKSSDKALARTVENAVAQWMFDNDTNTPPATEDLTKAIADGQVRATDGTWSTPASPVKYLDDATANHLKAGTNYDTTTGVIIGKSENMTITYNGATGSCKAEPK